MAEPVKVKFDYQNPENVEAEVPGAQKIREAQNEEQNGDESHVVTSTEVQSTGGKVVTRHRQVDTEKRNGVSEETVTMEDKHEDRRCKTKIPVSRFRQTVEKVKADRRGSKDRSEHESHIPIRKTSIPKQGKDKPVTTVKKEVTVTKTEIKKDSEPIVTKTVITSESTDADEEFDKIFADIIDTPTENFDDKILNTKIDDPDKLESKFEEIIHDYDENKEEPSDREVVRRSKIPFFKRQSQQEIELSAQADRTSKIIAARDKLRLRHSLNKTESFEEQLDRELNKAEYNLNADTTNAPESNTITETKHEVIASPNAKTEFTRHFSKTVSTSSSVETENVASSCVVETITVKEITTNDSEDKKENNQYTLTEENVEKGCIKIGIPVLNSYVHEFSNNDESSKTVEVKRVLSYSSNSEDLVIKNNYSETKNIADYASDEIEKSTAGMLDFERQVSKTKEITLESKFSKDLNHIKHTDMFKIKDDLEPDTEHATEEVQFRVKIGRVTNKEESKELIETESNKIESINELTKKKSVLSKIAMFERKEVDEPAITKRPKKESKLPKLVTKDWQQAQHVHVHTPLIVDEVFKPFQTDINLNNDDNKADNQLKTDAEITKGEQVTFVTSNSVHYSVEHKTQLESKITQESETIEEVTSKIKNDSQHLINKVETAIRKNVEPSQDSLSTDLTLPNTDFDQGRYENKPIPTEIKLDHEINDLPKSRKFNTNKDILAPLIIPKIDYNEYEFKEITPKTPKLSTTKELQSPVVIPGFKPVSQLLRSFESLKEVNRTPRRTLSKAEYKSAINEQLGPVKYTSIYKDIKTPEPEVAQANEIYASSTEISYSSNNDIYDINHDFRSLDDVFTKDSDDKKREQDKEKREEDIRKAKSLVELDLGDAVKGKVNNIMTRLVSVDRTDVDKKSVLNIKEMPRKRSVSEKIALFEGLTPSRSESPRPLRIFKSESTIKIDHTEHSRTFRSIETQRSSVEVKTELKKVEREQKVEKEQKVESGQSDEEVAKKIEDLKNAKLNYGSLKSMTMVELSNGAFMPVISLGTAMLDPRLIHHIISAAIDLGYRAIDCAYIYGNERAVGEAIRAKIEDGTVKREDLFITSKLWSTYHRSELVETACRASLVAMGLDYFDLYLIHNPMSFKEGGAAIPKIATVIQYSEHDYLDAWYGMETLVSKGLVKSIGVSNFNSVQLQRVLEKGKVKPVVNQLPLSRKPRHFVYIDNVLVTSFIAVLRLLYDGTAFLGNQSFRSFKVECHPYLSQQRLDLFCSDRNVTLMCYGTLGSKSTPGELRGSQAAVIDDPLVQVMASGLGISTAQLLISYQLENGHAVVVKSTSAAHLWDNLQALDIRITSGQVDALHALNRNKRIFTFKGMGDTHKNYPFKIAF